MRRPALLTLVVAAFLTSGSALGFQGKRCGMITYHGVSNGQAYWGKDTVSVVRGGTPCAKARTVDRRADEGFPNVGWHCAFLQHGTLTRCTSASRRAQIEGRAYTPPSATPAPAPTPTPACYPLTDSGTCYEPGEYCRVADYGSSGVAGDGEPIICEYNNGWRWEPA